MSRISFFESKRDVASRRRADRKCGHYRAAAHAFPHTIRIPQGGVAGSFLPGVQAQPSAQRHVDAELQDEEDEDQQALEAVEDVADVEDRVLPLEIVFLQEERHYLAHPGHPHDDEQFDIHGESTAAQAEVIRLGNSSFILLAHRSLFFVKYKVGNEIIQFRRTRDIVQRISGFHFATRARMVILDVFFLVKRKSWYINLAITVLRKIE